MANWAICLCHMIDRELSTYIANKDREFVEQGGIRERMTAARVGYRNNQKAELAEAHAEIARLKMQLAGETGNSRKNNP